MAAPTFVDAGTLAGVSSGTTLTTTIPGAATTNDVMVLALESQGSMTFSQPSGWEDFAVAIDNAAQSTAWFWKRHDGSESDPSSTTNNTMSGALAGFGRIYVIRGCITTGDPFEDVTMAGAPTLDNNPDTAEITTTGVDRLVMSFVIVDDDNTWSSGNPPTNWSAAGTIATNTTGGDCMMDAIQRTVATAQTVGTATWTGSAATVGAAATSGSFSSQATWTGGAAAVGVAGTSGSFTPGTATWTGSTATVGAAGASGSFTPGAATWTGSAATVGVAGTSGSFVADGAPQTWNGSAATVGAAGTSGNFVGGGTATWTGSSATVGAAGTSGSFSAGALTWTGSTATVGVAALSGSFTPAGALWVGSPALVAFTATSGNFVGGGTATWTGSAATVGVAGLSGVFFDGSLAVVTPPQRTIRIPIDRRILAIAFDNRRIPVRRTP